MANTLLLYFEFNIMVEAEYQGLNQRCDFFSKSRGGLDWLLKMGGAGG